MRGNKSSGVLTEIQSKRPQHGGDAVLVKPAMIRTLQAAELCVARFSAERELRIREMPEGFSLKLSLLSACSPTVPTLDRDSQSSASALFRCCNEAKALEPLA